MKCPYCGTNLTIDDAKCPFCGNENPYAKKHRQDMFHFKREFNNTKKTVLDESKQLTSNMVKIVTTCILAVILLIFIFLNFQSYDVSDFFIKSSIEMHLREHQNKLNQYEQERDYLSLNNYYREYDLYHSDSMKEYRKVSEVSRAYASIFSSVYELYNYDQLDEEGVYLRDKGELIKNVADNIEYMYKNRIPKDWDDPQMYAEPHLSYINDCIKESENMIQVYLGLSEEIMQSFESYSPARRAVLIEEVVLENE